MSNFKIGDLVKDRWYPANGQGVVTRFDEDGDLYVEWSYGENLHYTSDLELVRSEQPKFKVGDRVMYIGDVAEGFVEGEVFEIGTRYPNTLGVIWDNAPGVWWHKFDEVAHALAPPPEELKSTKQEHGPCVWCGGMWTGSGYWDGYLYRDGAFCGPGCSEAKHEYYHGKQPEIAR